MHLDLFTWLAEGPATVGDLSARLGVAEHRLSTLLSALAGLDLVDKQGDRWANGPASARYLVRGAPADFGDYYRLQIDGQLYPALAHLTAGLLGREQELAPGLSASGMADPAEADRFSRAQHAGSLGPAVLLSQRVDLTGRAHLLDVAGGTGAFAITLCLRHPLLRATIVDFPNVVTVGRRFVEQAGLADRIDFVAGDARNCPWPQADVVLMSYLLSAVPGADIPFLLAHARDVLDPNGLLLVHDFMLNDDRCGPDLAALWFLQYLAESIDTLSFTGADLTRQLSFLGFCDVEVGTLVSDITKLAVARAPTGDAGGELDGQPLVREGS